MLFLGIDGSPWKTSPKPTVLLKEALDAAREAIPSHHSRTVLVRLCDYKYGHHEGSLDDPVPDVLKPVVEYMLAADGIILVSPVHYFNISGRMLSFIHHLNLLEYPKFPFRGKVLGAIAHCHDDGGQKAVMDMLGPLLHFGFMIPPDGLFYRNSNLKESEGDWQTKEHLRLGRSVARLAFQTRHMTW